MLIMRNEKSKGSEARMKLKQFIFGRDVLLDVYELKLVNLTRGGGRRSKCIRGKRALINFCRRELEMTEMESQAATGLDRTTVNWHFHKHDNLMEVNESYRLMYDFFIVTYRTTWADYVLAI